MPNIRAKARKGDRIIGVQSSRGGATPKILYLSIVDNVISCKSYCEFNARDQPSKYRYRRDNCYGINRYDKLFILFKNKPNIGEYLYWLSRIKQNIGHDLEKKVILSKKYKTYFNQPGPKITRAFTRFLKSKTKDYKLDVKFEDEVEKMLENKQYQEERSPNAYDHDNPTEYKVLRKVDPALFAIYENSVSLEDIQREIIRTGGVTVNKFRKNARRSGQSEIKSMTLGRIYIFGKQYVTQETMKRIELFAMVTGYAHNVHGLDIGNHYGAICINEN